ncbi:MAG: hypothetical protein IJL74_04215 [Bacilli bacterium]|nr:hypothetical protein [Bacilli bacterium]
MKSDNSVKEEVKEDTFKEEVPEEELHSKLGVDDHIYVSGRKGIYGGSLLMIFALLLAFSALFATFYGLVSLGSDLGKRDIGVHVDEYRLKVIHSNYDYGGKIESFANYTNSNKSFSYNFSVTNENAVDLDYFISLKIKNKSDGLDLGLVNYDLLRNGSSVKSGKMSEIKGNIFSTTIPKKSADDYEIKIWGDNSIKDLGLKFKIEVVV